VKVFATDLDGILLDLDDAIARAYTDILGQPIKVTDITGWNHGHSLGISQESVSAMWKVLWLNYPAWKYAGANVFIESLKVLGYETIVITNRPTIDAAYACGRDMTQLEGLEDVIIMDKHKLPKSYYLNKIKATWYIDDNIDYAIEAKFNCPLVEQVFLMERNHNRPCKDIVGYHRLYSYADVLQYLSQHSQ